jgi:membrane protein YqaA with SNARE-associated domain
LGLLKGPDARSGGETFNLRIWFAGFVGWLVVLTVVAVWAFGQVERGDASGLSVWLTVVSLFYLSLCCLFFPLPTAWVVLLLASNDVGLVASIPVRVVLVATVCATATAIANLNEYHIITFFLRYRQIGRVRDARLYQRASGWFSVAPFWTITAFSFLPIPVDVVRMLAVAARYPRLRFAWAYFLGRFFRYGVFALSAAWLCLDAVDIAIIQAIFVVLAGSKVIHAWLRRRRKASG